MDSLRRSPTEFESRVYEAIRTIPEGRVASYRSLARHLGCGSAQAVGQALRRNPFAPETPCHRVVAADGRLGGFRGEREGEGESLAAKRYLLEAEGVRFLADGSVDPLCRYEFAP